MGVAISWLLEERGFIESIQEKEKQIVSNFCLKLYVKAQIFRGENGQDLIEYALIAALIALAATAGMQTIATDINSAFTNIGTKLTGYTS
jgi:pilus assembly protein Flp/PilA